MKNTADFSLLHQVMGSRKISKGVLMTHLYLLMVAVLLNSMMYVVVTKPSFDKYLTSSVLSVQDELVNNSDDSLKISDLESQIAEFTLEIETLKSMPPQIVRVEPVEVEKEVIIQEVVRVVHEQAPTSTTSKASLPVIRPQQINETGAMIVNAPDCESGYASVTPRLIRNCVVE